MWSTKSEIYKLLSVKILKFLEPWIALKIKSLFLENFFQTGNFNTLIMLISNLYFICAFNGHKCSWICQEILFCFLLPSTWKRLPSSKDILSIETYGALNWQMMFLAGWNPLSLKISEKRYIFCWIFTTRIHWKVCKNGVRFSSF